MKPSLPVLSVVVPSLVIVPMTATAPAATARAKANPHLGPAGTSPAGASHDGPRFTILTVS